MAVVAITGNRDAGINDWKGYTVIFFDQLYQEKKIDRVIQGMAAGADLIAGAMALNYDIPVVSVRPWAGHSVPAEWQSDYDCLMNESEVVTLDPSIKFPGDYVYFNRNKWMMDRGDIIVSIWDGRKSGGTWHAIQYAKTIGKPIYNYDYKKDEQEWLK
jgi:hypothetical protein